ncbi:phosphoribosylamine--glycine ligase [Belnapia sp. T18]|uniref:Phosphoribosylamine--glycine ligase n=1 Tax=Belnapia arida TaxID=2804533 RepID=A0ABS1TZG2_9PROT|nr:phosphoribosylamine--glycine ligase [Belnapia arida]MBL6077806.1 phosphoribosylamine--glycine ligase [Belnapia arida]
MRRAAAALALLLPLGGCGLYDRLLGAAPQRQPETPEQQECREEARQSPAVTALNRQRMPGNSVNDDRLNREERTLLARAFRDCLRTRGLTLPGGVETEQPR